MRLYYRISGLQVASEIPLPGAIALSVPVSPSDVLVRRERAISLPSKSQKLGPNWAIDGDRFLLRVPSIAKFLITAGRDIAIEVEPGVEEKDAIVFLLGTAFGVLLYQRRRIVLHASAILVGGRAVLLCGKSGAGKATLAAALNERGYAHVTDDVCCVDFGAEGIPTVFPDGKMIKLWLDAVNELELGGRRGTAVRKSIDKFYVEPTSPLSASAPPIAAIYALREQRWPFEPGIEKPSTLDASQILRRGLYRAGLMAKMGLSELFLARAADIQRHAGLYYLTRPFDMAAMPAAITHLEAHWRTLGLTSAGT